MARHRLPDEGQGPLRRGGAAARRCPPFLGTATPSRRQRCSGSTSNRATTIAASCSCTKERTVSCMRCWEPRAAVVRGGTGRIPGHAPWRDGRLTLGYMPRSREESPYWRRIGIIQDAVAQRRALRLKTVIDISRGRIPRNRTLCLVLGGGHAAGPPSPLSRAISPAHRLRARSRFQQAALSTVQARLAGIVRRVAVDGDRHGIRLRRGPRGRRFHAGQAASARRERRSPWPPTAAGRIAACGWKPAPTYRLDGGRPISGGQDDEGLVVRAGRGVDSLLQRPPAGHSAWPRSGPIIPPPGSTTALLHSTAVGLGTTLSPTQTGTLFLKINDSAGELDDNAGTLKVEVRRE